MKTLYVSDLDGTLLSRDAHVSEFSKVAINQLVKRGMSFSYATARSLTSASIVSNGIATTTPVIIYNGVFIIDPGTCKILNSTMFSGQEAAKAASIFTENQIYPLVYAFVDGKECVTWLKGSENAGMLHYMNSRSGDKRFRSVNHVTDLFEGEIFYLTAIGERSQLQSINEQFSIDRNYRCILQRELNREEYWFEVMPQQASKAEAIVRLKQLLGFDKVIAFGDGLNDLPMFEISDEAYAVDNAVPELKKQATGVIASNDQDGVARWLLANFKP